MSGLVRFYPRSNVIVYNINDFIRTGLHEFVPNDNQKYDVIWIQWVLGYVTDSDLVTFLKKCWWENVYWTNDFFFCQECLLTLISCVLNSKLLNPNGVIVVKENVSQTDEGEIDTEDSSITRSFLNFCIIFQQANLKCIAKRTQRNFPRELFRVEMFALKPASVWNLSLCLHVKKTIFITLYELKMNLIVTERLLHKIINWKLY